MSLNPQKVESTDNVQPGLGEEEIVITHDQSIILPDGVDLVVLFTFKNGTTMVLNYRIEDGKYSQVIDSDEELVVVGNLRTPQDIISALGLNYWSRSNGPSVWKYNVKE